MSPSKRTQTTVALLALLVVKVAISGRCAITGTTPRVFGDVSVSTEDKKSALSSLRSHPDFPATPRSMPTILQLVGDANDNYKCPEGLVFVKDSIDPSFYEKEQRKIPKVTHMTSKTRCMTKAFADNVDSWRLEGHSLFLHDDEAVGRLLNRWWPEFPNMHVVKNCMMPGAAIADLWRYVMLWEFGGVYTDIDNAPGPWFWNKTGSAITNATDALFEQEKDGFPSQYFFAASPHHPVMYLAVQMTMLRLMEVQSIMKQYVPFVTGPGAIKSAVVSASFQYFQLCWVGTVSLYSVASLFIYLIFG